MKAKLTRLYFDDEIEMFTGAPMWGHVRVLSTLDPWPPKKKISEKLDISTNDWDAWKVELEGKAKVMKQKKQQSYGK